jgi:hypothetical protein
MSDDKLIELERRLALAEREVERTRAQVRALQEQQQPRSRLRRDRILGLLGVSLLAFAVTRAIDTEAQGAPQVLKVKAPFEVMDASGKKAILSINQFANGIELQIGDTASGGVMLGVGASGAGFVRVRTPAGKDGVTLAQYRGSPMGVYVLGPDGQAIEGSLALNPSNKGRLVLGDAKSGGVDAGVGVSGAGFMVVRRDDGKTGIDMGQLEGRPMAVGIFGAGGKELVSLRTDQKGGSVRVMNPTGVGVAGLLADNTGGGLALTGPTGGKSAVSLSVEPSGGKVRVFPQAGGHAQAELTAADEGGGGAVNVYNSSGEAVGWLTTTGAGDGRFEIGRSGKIYVRAGVAFGLGNVIAGPRIGGAPPGLTIPDYIQGKK